MEEPCCENRTEIKMPIGEEMPMKIENNRNRIQNIYLASDDDHTRAIPPFLFNYGSFLL